MNRASLTLRRVLQTQIPLSKQMGIRVRACSEKNVEFALPLKPNRNHKKTAFGGTLVAAQALASWSLLMQILARHFIDAEVVLQRERSEFYKPVVADFSVKTRSLARGDVNRFLRTLQSHHKARLEISAQVVCDSQVACEFFGQYVAVMRRPPKRPSQR